MEGNTWSEHCEMFHQIPEERGEPLFLRIDVIDAFSFDVFLELRWCQFRHTAVRYHSTFGRRQIDSIEYRKFLEEYKRTGREMPTEEIANALPLWHFLRFQYVDENIFTAVKTPLKNRILNIDDNNRFAAACTEAGRRAKKPPCKTSRHSAKAAARFLCGGLCRF